MPSLDRPDFVTGLYNIVHECQCTSMIQTNAAREPHRDRRDDIGRHSLYANRRPFPAPEHHALTDMC